MEKEILKVSLIQLDIKWHDVESNLMNFLRLLKNTPDDTDLILLPETFNTGFTMQTAKLAETLNGRTHQLMIDNAIQRKCAIGGSLIIEDHGKYFNRFVLVDALGNTHYYDKRHLFTMGMEDKNYVKGNKNLLVSVNGVQIMPLICYDIRFPVWSRNKDNYDILVYVANWPKVRQNVWDALLQARAIENQCYVLGVNRTGKDGNEIEYVGGSRIIGPKGQVLANLLDQEDVLNYNIDISELHQFRKRFPVLSDADYFKIIHHPE